jgi:hypothetical protein
MGPALSTSAGPAGTWRPICGVGLGYPFPHGVVWPHKFYRPPGPNPGRPWPGQASPQADPPAPSYFSGPTAVPEDRPPRLGARFSWPRPIRGAVPSPSCRISDGTARPGPRPASRKAYVIQHQNSLLTFRENRIKILQKMCLYTVS